MAAAAAGSGVQIAALPTAAGFPAAAANGLGFRPMRQDDLAFLASLYASTREEQMAQLPWPEAQRRQFLQMQFTAQQRHYQEHYLAADFLVMERGGSAVGRLCVAQFRQEIRIIDIALMPECRGQGLGAAVIRDVMRQAQARGMRVGLYVEKSNPAARLYRRLGFETVDEGDVHDLLRWKSPA